jgi:hypothetical protein
MHGRGHKECTHRSASFPASSPWLPPTDATTVVIPAAPSLLAVASAPSAEAHSTAIAASRHAMLLESSLIEFCLTD